MKRYAYFPGCSCSDGSARAYGLSTLKVANAWGIQLSELEDWNCCGSTPYGSMHELGTHCLAARNLSLAEKQGTELVTPCSSCYITHARTNDYLQRYPELKSKVAEALSAGGLVYEGGVKVRHLLEVFVRETPSAEIKARIKKNLRGLKVGAYYGCQVVRPLTGFDSPELPQSLDSLVADLGAEPVDFPLKARCCGGSLVIPEKSAALALAARVLDSASRQGAECLVTVCPLCQLNLDAYQGQLDSCRRTRQKIPVLFFTQLVGLALGLEGRELGLETNIIPVDGVLEKCR